MSSIPDRRVRGVNDSEVSDAGDYVLYWMISSRRGTYNFGLERGVEWAKQLNKPLVILEALRCDYQWASDRLHRFVIEGMADNAEHFTKKNVVYYPYLEATRGSGKGLLKELASHACVVVSDDFPCFFLPRMIDAASAQIPVRFELVDSNGLLPMRAADKVFLRAFDFRRFLQKNLLPHLADVPQRDPLSQVKLPTLKALPAKITTRWPMADPAKLLSSRSGLASFPIDHSVGPVETVGGSRAGGAALRTFMKSKLPIYDSDRNQPEKEATSGLSPYLHFGHVSVHEVFEQLTRLVEWTPNLVAEKATGSNSGWWGADAEVESFLDELITWRELGYNMCWQRDDYDQYDSLPEWAQQTLAEHADDHRPHVYSLEQFELAKTHDELWNAAQRQLVREGRIHNYLRMLWGKKIFEWSASARESLDVMIELNNKYALDGRNPNSYSGIFWVLGRYDRAWGPERPIFGKIRYMTSENTARKVKVKNYIAEYSP
ncbi:MAG: deoxyribodipyrimidine photolyase [Planctomycetaceae bacterium]|nr:deoxyribodipyrimidine photolyase [Planctomycetaceae bacterium]HRX78286.1 deoxyribodipyrimidine photolyase [Pirellulaceae bacterium]